MQRITPLLGRLVADSTSRPAWHRYAVALALPVLAFAVTPLATHVTRAPFFSVFTLAVVLSSIYGGRAAGWVTVAASFVFNTVLSAPLWTFRVASPDDVVRLIISSCIGLLIAAFIGATGELQRNLEIARRRLAITLESIGDAVIATDAHGRITFMNRVAEEATRWRAEEASGVALEAVFHIFNEETRTPVENPVRKVLEQGRIVGLANHTVLIRRDGTEIPIDDSAAPIRDTKGAIVGVVLVFRDVTEARLSQKALMHAEKLATVGKLASTIAHEINNPLEAVGNLLFLVGEDRSLSPLGKSHVDMAQTELARAADIAKQTLSFHKGESIASIVNVRELVDSILRLYAGRAAIRNVQMINEAPPDVTMHAVSSQIRQLVSNFVTNALDAMHTGGTLTITAESVWVDGNPRVRISFSDTGHGIDPENLHRIFEPFFTTKKDVGTGLGLWVAKRIVEDHQGELLVDSRSSGETGTTFTVVLPQEAGKSATNRG